MAKNNRAMKTFYRSQPQILQSHHLMHDNCSANCIQQIAVILQQEIQNCKTKIYIASFQVAQLQSHLKGGYVNFGFAVLDFMLQDHCNLL